MCTWHKYQLIYFEKKTSSKWIKTKSSRWCTKFNSIQEIQDAVQKKRSMAVAAGLGYRRMRSSLQSQSIICRHEDVRLIMKNLDPEGVALRKERRLHRRKYVSPGRNYAWHIDGHDKLKPFGFFHPRVH